MIGLAFVTAVALGGVAGDGTVRGTILSDRDEPVAGVRIEIPAEDILTWSDSSGRYVIHGLEPGTYEIRFARFTYDPLSLTVTMPDQGALDLDVRLRMRFVLLPSISAVAMGWASNGLPEIGSRVLPAERIWESPLAPHPDILATLRSVPGIDMAEESPTQLHVRGGSADENLVLLNGAPVYTQNHTSGVLSAISPDAVSELVVHTGVLPARYGGRLSSVVDVRTRTPDRERARFRGGAGVPDVRALVEAPLPDGWGGVMLGGRRTAHDLFGRNHSERVTSSGFEDLFGKVSLDLAGGELDIVAFHAGNWLTSSAGPREGAEAAAAPVEKNGLDPYNSVRWSGGTDALAWTGFTKGGVETSFRLWRADTHSDVEWGSLEERHRMRGSLEHWGAAGDVAWKTGSSVGRAGLAIERLTSAYRAGSLVAGRPDTVPEPRLGASPWIVSSYVEHRWIPRDRWMMNNGLRTVHVEGHGVEIEPRLSAHYRPRDGMTLSAGFGRVHQYVQSLANEESLLSAAYAVEPLVAAGPSGVPVSRSDQWTVSVEAELTQRLALTIDGYARWMDDIVLVAPLTPEPFATAGYVSGEGRVDGLGAALVYHGERLYAEAIAEWISVRRSYRGATYHPRLERRRSLAAAAAFRVLPSTIVRTAFQAASGPPTSTLRPGFEWEVFDQLSGEVEFSGTPIRSLEEALNGRRHPTYVRWDVGVRRTWRIRNADPDGSITIYVDAINILGRKNVLGYQLSTPGSGPRVLSLRPISLLFGIEWQF